MKCTCPPEKWVDVGGSVFCETCRSYKSPGTPRKAPKWTPKDHFNFEELLSAKHLKLSNYRKELRLKTR